MITTTIELRKQMVEVKVTIVLDFIPGFRITESTRSAYIRFFSTFQSWSHWEYQLLLQR